MKNHEKSWKKCWKSFENMLECHIISCQLWKTAYQDKLGYKKLESDHQQQQQQTNVKDRAQSSRSKKQSITEHPLHSATFDSNSFQILKSYSYLILTPLTR